ncbi:hypothetical protein I2I11_02205 [Pontibacter sp. 172403-2]|uniref:hypothetical protein n=1 Tax=Pontibacter rufus TaxID=2791028 RepID=UPI0018AF96BA|nr:hypothetical protein [Pontibacter sp. 172403-2]MBF9252096.1 hypothetical protein [Pontibacter sp. 172403-2]
MNIIERPDIANTATAAILVGGGLTSFFLNENRPKTALIPLVAGGALLLLNPGVKAGDKTAAHAAVGLTSALSIMTGLLFAKSVAPAAQLRYTREVRTRRAATFGLMTLSGLAAAGVYVAGFIQKRRNKQV